MTPAVVPALVQTAEGDEVYLPDEP